MKHYVVKITIEGLYTKHALLCEKCNSKTLYEVLHCHNYNLRPWYGTLHFEIAIGGFDTKYLIFKDTVRNTSVLYRHKNTF